MFWTVFVLLFLSVTASKSKDKVHLGPVDSSDDFLLLRRAVSDIVSSNNISQLYVVSTQKLFRDNYWDLSIILQDLNEQVKMTYVNFESYRNEIKVSEMSGLVLMYMSTLKTDMLEGYMTYIHYNVKPRIKLTLVVRRCVDQSQLREAFRILWHDFMINVIIVQQCDGIVTVHAYFPYANHQCGVYSPSNIMRIGYFNKTNQSITYTTDTLSNSSSNFHTYYNTEPFFPAKVPFNMEECSLMVGISIWPPLVNDPTNTDDAGFEIDFLFNVRREMNLKINYNTTINWQRRPPYLLDRIVDLVIGANFVQMSSDDFDNSHWYFPNRLLWIAPKAPLHPKQDVLWSIILEEYEVFVSIIVFVPVAALCVFMMMKWMYRMRMYGNIDYNRFGYLQIFWTLARATVDATAPCIPSISAVRLCFGLWNLICVIINCFYQTTVTSFLSEPGFIKQIMSIDDILNSKHDILVAPSYANPIVQIYGQKLLAKTKFKTSPTSPEVTVRTALKRVSLNQAITFTDETRAEYLSLQWIQSNDRKTLYLMNEVPVKFFWIQLSMSSGHPMFERINDLVLRCGSIGFWNHELQRRYMSRRKIRTMIRRQIIIYNKERGIDNTHAIEKFNEAFHDADNDTSTMETNEHDIIDRFLAQQYSFVTLEHLYPALKMFLCGLMIATGVFFAELAIHSYLSLNTIF